MDGPLILELFEVDDFMNLISRSRREVYQSGPESVENRFSDALKDPSSVHFEWCL